VRNLVFEYLPAWPDSAPLVITAVVALAMTAGIVILALLRYEGEKGDILLFLHRPRPRV